MMEDIISGQNNLRNALTSCDDPLMAIEAFQVGFSQYILFVLKLIVNIFPAEKWNCFAFAATNAAALGSPRCSSIRLSYINP